MNASLLERPRTKQLFEKAGAIIADSHFVYAKKEDGWYHGPSYVNKDALYLYPSSVRELCQQLASNFFGRAEVIVGPTVGGVALAQWTAYWLSGNCREVLAVCADEENVLEPRVVTCSLHFGFEPLSFSAYGKVDIAMSGNQLQIKHLEKVGTRRIIKRGYANHINGKLCGVVEDVINTGQTLAKTIAQVRERDGVVAWAGALCNRSARKVTAKTLGVPELFSLVDLDMPMFKEQECPICKEKGVESVRTDLGYGKDFLTRLGKLQ